MRLIDADKLLVNMKKELQKYADGEITSSDETRAIITAAIALRNFVNATPTVDYKSEAFPVVKCGRCENFNTKHFLYDYDYCELLYYCDGTHIMTHENCSCSFGKENHNATD